MYLCQLIHYFIMKIQIKNFGPIAYLEFDMDKDLHLIYGKNAIGKSYSTYLIYCLLKNVKDKQVVYVEETAANFVELGKKGLEHIKIGSPTNITDAFCSLITQQLSTILLSDFQNSLQNTFNLLKNLNNRFTHQNYEIIIYLSEKEKIIFVANEEGELNLIYTLPCYKVEFKEKNAKTTRFQLFFDEENPYYSSENKENFSTYLGAVGVKYINDILQKLQANISDMYYLPASRSGLYQAINAFSQMIAELSQNRFFLQNKKIELPAYSEPVADYFIDLSTANANNVNAEYADIIKILEKSILQGEVIYDNQTKKINYKPTNTDLILGLSEVSSMVSEISPMVIFFKHILNFKYTTKRGKNGHLSNKKYDIIFIEEPEAHLHPEMQVALMEIFAKMIGLNLKIFITSHSNYMFNKLNNLILSHEIDKDKVAVYHLVKNAHGSTQNQDMQVTEEGINDDNFQETAIKLYEERMKIYEN